MIEVISGHAGITMWRASIVSTDDIPIESLIEEAGQVANALEHFRCANTHDRNKHLANVRCVIMGYKEGRTGRANRLTVERARQWLIDTMSDQMDHADMQEVTYVGM